MELKVIRSIEVDSDIESDELQHHGTKGMRWGVRRYQNKDGSLTDAGKRRYNKEMAKLKAEEEKIKAAEKVVANKQKTQAKIDKLDAKKAELEERKKALKGKKDDEPENKQDEGETPEQRHDRIVKSSNPKEIYENKDVLTNVELQDRINRLNLESQIYSKIPAEAKKTGMDYMNKATQNITAATNLYKSVDSAFTTVKNSAIGKTLAKNLGIELPDDKKPRESLSSFLKNIDKKTDKEIQDRNQTENNIDALRNKQKQREKQAEKEANRSLQEKAQVKQDKQNQQQNQKKILEKQISDAEINKKVQEAAKELEVAAKKSGKTAAEAEVNMKQLEAILDEYGDFFFLN